MKTLITDHSWIKCNICKTLTFSHVADARARGWHIPWQPSERILCPQCWGNPKPPPLVVYSWREILTRIWPDLEGGSND